MKISTLNAGQCESTDTIPLNVTGIHSAILKCFFAICVQPYFLNWRFSVEFVILVRPTGFKTTFHSSSIHPVSMKQENEKQAQRIIYLQLPRKGYLSMLLN